MTRRRPQPVQLGGRRGDRGPALRPGQLGDVLLDEVLRRELREDPLGLTALVARDVPARRGRRRGGDPGDLDRLGVHPDRVQREVRQDDGVVGGDAVEVGTREAPARVGDALGEEPDVPPVAADPRAGWDLRGGGPDEPGDVGDRGDLARRDVQRERRAARAPLGDVGVRVVHPREHRCTRQVEHLRARAREGADLARGPDRRDATAADGDGLRVGPRRRARVDPRPDDHQLGCFAHRPPSCRASMLLASRAAGDRPAVWRC